MEEEKKKKLKIISKFDIYLILVSLTLLLIGVVFYFWPIPEKIKDKVKEYSNSKVKISRCIYNKGMGYYMIPRLGDERPFYDRNGKIICRNGGFEWKKSGCRSNDVYKICFPIYNN